jgi:hypothetical protein
MKSCDILRENLFFIPFWKDPLTQLTQLLGLSHVSLEQIEVTEGLITLSLSMDTTEAACPQSGQATSRVRSQYQRTLQDLACVGKRLLVQVRRFFCANTACVRKIVAERLPDLAGVYARGTTRCMTALAELGLTLGGRAGAHLSGSLGLTSSRMTILRILRRTPDPAPPHATHSWRGRLGMAPRKDVWHHVSGPRTERAGRCAARSPSRDLRHLVTPASRHPAD